MLGLLLLLAGSSAKADYPISPVPFTQVRLEGGLLGDRQKINRSATLRHLLKQNEATGRNENFKAAAGVPGAKYEGYFFNDSDVYKSLEAIGYSLAQYKDPELEREADAVIDLIGKAQEPDGWLFTSTTCANRGIKSAGPSKKWDEDGGEHQTYCAGHLYEAAVAYFKGTGKRKLLDIALKNANLLCAAFGPNGTAKHTSGHEEVEIGLVKLYRLTGNRTYLDTAKRFLERRGRIAGRKFLFGDYSQDHKPVREQTEAVGHAVRAAYLYMGMADVAALTDDAGYRKALDNLWDSAVGKKSYITGAIGATGAGEAFGAEYEMPNLTAYAETCSSIAFMMWNHRMFLLHGDAKYMDMFEQTLFNAFMSGYAEDGCHFFYPNPLQSRGAQRPEWFGCACCPPNVSRFIASLGGYAYAVKGNAVYANLFLYGTGTVKVGGQDVTLACKTNYPWDGKVTYTVKAAKPVKFDFLVRRPAWAEGKAHPMNLYTFDRTISNYRRSNSVTGVKKTAEVPGYTRISGTWRNGDTVTVSYTMQPEIVKAHPNVKADRDRIAVQRGPVVYCAEFADQPDQRVLSLIADPKAPLTLGKRTGVYGTVPVITTTMRRAVRDRNGTPIVGGETVKATLTPYFTWANRGRGEMTVWLPTAASAAWPDPAPTLAYRAKVTTSFNGGAQGMVDQLLPNSSIDHGVPFFHYWPHKGTTEWADFEWTTPQTVKGMDVYWFQDEGIGECRTPESWRVLAWIDGAWVPVQGAGVYGTAKDKFNSVSFEPVTTTKIRLEVTQKKDWASGMHEVVIR